MLSEEEIVVSLIVAEEEEKSRSQRKRRFWIHKINRKRLELGEFHTLFPDLVEDDCKFFQYFRMTHQKFEELLHVVNTELLRKSTNMREPIGPKERLAVCLR